MTEMVSPVGQLVGGKEWGAEVVIQQVSTTETDPLLVNGLKMAQQQVSEEN